MTYGSDGRVLLWPFKTRAKMYEEANSESNPQSNEIVLAENLGVAGPYPIYDVELLRMDEGGGGRLIVVGGQDEGFIGMQGYLVNF